MLKDRFSVKKVKLKSRSNMKRTPFKAQSLEIWKPDDIQESSVDHQLRMSGTGKLFSCNCLCIHCQFSGVTSPPRARMTDPPLHDPILQHSSKGNPFINPYRNPLANKSPAPVASVAIVSPMAGTCTTCSSYEMRLNSKGSNFYITVWTMALYGKNFVTSKKKS